MKTGSRSTSLSQRLRNQVEALMRDSGNTRLMSPAMLLWLLSGVYGAAARLRAIGYGQGYCNIRRLPCKVISIGNITVGGTGKTPMTRYVARRMQTLGFKTGIVSRGYKGSAEKAGGLVSDGKRVLMDAATAGDEPYLLATGLGDIPVAVGRDRYTAAMNLLRACRLEVIILDDAFQHLALDRDLNIVLLDHRRPFGNSHLLPRGTLREPLKALRRADVFIVTRRGRSMRQDWQQLVAKLPSRPVLEASTQTTIAKVVRSGHTTDNRPDGSATDDSVGRLKGKRCFAFSGLADNAGFIRAVTQTGAALAGTLDYADHYAYTATDLKRLSAAALDCGAELIVTTAKDFVRLDASYRWPLDLVSLDVDFEFHPDSDAFVTIIQNRLRPSSQSLGGRQS